MAQTKEGILTLRALHKHVLDTLPSPGIGKSRRCSLRFSWGLTRRSPCTNLADREKTCFVPALSLSRSVSFPQKKTYIELSHRHDEEEDLAPRGGMRQEFSAGTAGKGGGCGFREVTRSLGYGKQPTSCQRDTVRSEMSGCHTEQKKKTGGGCEAYYHHWNLTALLPHLHVCAAASHLK